MKRLVFALVILSSTVAFAAGKTPSIQCTYYEKGNIKSTMGVVSNSVTTIELMSYKPNQPNIQHFSFTRFDTFKTVSDALAFFQSQYQENVNKHGASVRESYVLFNRSNEIGDPGASPVSVQYIRGHINGGGEPVMDFQDELGFDATTSGATYDQVVWDAEAACIRK